MVDRPTTHTRRRRQLLLAGAACVVGAALYQPARARAAEFTLKFASNLPLSHPLNVRAKEAAGRIARDSGGRVEMQLFPSNQLGADGDLIGLLRGGAIELLTVSGLVAATVVPTAAISGMGFAFADYDSVWKALDGPMGEYIRSELAKADLLAMPCAWDNGFRQMTTSRRPIRSVEDLKGLKMRVPVSPLWTSMFSAFEASPTPVPPPEIYLALQTGLVDGQENGLVAVEVVKLYEVQRYCALTNHLWDGYWMLANRQRFERLPAELQDIIRRHLDTAALDERADVAALARGAQSRLEQLGMRFNSVDQASFRDKLRQRGFYREWNERLGPKAWSVLEATVGSLG